VRVDRESGIFESHCEHDACGLPADPRQRLELVTIARHVAAVEVDDRS